MYSKRKLKSNEKQVIIQALSPSRRKCGKPYPRVYIVSLDGERFYKVHALSESQALSIVMSIGVNPPPVTPPPPAPGKESPTHSKSLYSATSISKVVAEHLLKHDLRHSKAMLKVQHRGKMRLKSIHKWKNN